MIRDLLPITVVKRIWAHWETPFKKGSRPVDQSRYLFDSSDPVAVTADCAKALAWGVDAAMPNSYAFGSYEDKCRTVLFAACKQVGLKVLINIDGANITSLAAYQTYVNRTKAVIDNMLPNYETWNGKPIITVFGKSGEQASWFQQVEAAHPDLCFLYYATPYGKNRMDWIKVAPDPTIMQAAFCATYSTKHDGGLYVPCVFMGFDDTVMRKVNDQWQGDPNGTLKATSVWQKSHNQYIPARVAPPEGPNAATWARTCANILKYYSASNPCPAAQIVTWSDQDEGTNVQRGIPKL